MQEVRPAVCRRDGERPTCEDERTLLRHKNEEHRRTSAAHFCQLDHCGGPASEGSREDPQEQHAVEKRENFWIFTPRMHGLNLDE